MKPTEGRHDATNPAEPIQSARARELADQFFQAHAAFSSFVATIPAEKWRRPVSAGDPRPVWILARHIAWGYLFEQSYFQAIAEGNPKPPVDEFKTMNAALAHEWDSLSRSDVVAAIEVAGRLAAEWVRGLSDQQLARRGEYYVGGPTWTVDDWIANILIGHIATHVPEMRAAVEGESALTG
jgi:hypothetical protein